MKPADRQALLFHILKPPKKTARSLLLLSEMETSLACQIMIFLLCRIQLSVPVILSFIALSFKTLCMILWNTDKETCVSVISNTSIVRA
jgi:hypothetical protein